MKKFVIYVYELSTSNDTEFEHNIIRGELHGVTQNELDYIGSDLELLKINPLNKNRRLLYLKIQFLPRSKYFSSRL